MWRAQFSNGEVLEEFNKKGQEVLFKKVLDRLNDLENLSIVLGDKTYTVRMTDGRFSIIFNAVEHHFFTLDVDAVDLKCIRPIYFVRETINFGTQGNVPKALEPPRVNFVALGFQANLNGRNVKRYLTIFPDGIFVIKDK